MAFYVSSSRMTTRWWIKLLLILLAVVAGIPLPVLARQKKPLPAATHKTPQSPSTPDILLARSGFADEDVGYLLFDPADGSPIEAHRADEPRIPASTNKVATIIAALKILGDDYHFETSLLTSGEISENTLQGNIYLRGGGDPTLTTDDLREFVVALQQAGIARVTGSFIFDDSFLTHTDLIDPKISITAPYNPGLSALSVNYNRIQLHWQQKPRIAALTSAVFSHAKGGAVPVEGITIGRLSDEVDHHIAFLHESTSTDGMTVDRWLLSPKLPPEGWEVLPVKLDPSRITALLFRTLCQHHGIELPLPERAPVPAGAQVLSTHQSEPLPEVAAGVLRYSNNLSAELIGLVASRKLSVHPLSLQESAATLTNWYHRTLSDAPWEGFLYANHSGLTTTTRISPRQMAAILRYGWSLPVGQSTFPELLSPPRWERLKGPDHIAVRAKSGTMNYADGLAGFLTTTQGRQLGFVVLITDFPKRLAQDETQDVRAAAMEPEGSGWTMRAKGLERALVNSWIVRY